MHGRLKVKTTAEQQLIKQKELQKKVIAYQNGMKQILSSRRPDTYNHECLAICARLLVVGPDIYTLWNYRKEVVLLELEWSKNKEDGDDQLNLFLENELKLTEQCLLANPKSYSSWHHRYWVLEHHVDANWNQEFELCTMYLTMDNRNFHCWDYRRLVLNKVQMPLLAEINFSTGHININFSNYSSWHYRSTLKFLTEDTIQDELSLVQNAVFTDPNDSSAWFYLRWVLSNSIVTKKHRIELLDSLNQLLELEPECRWILVAKCWLIEVLIDTIGNCIDDRLDCCEKLERLDTMRKGRHLDYKQAIITSKV